MHRSLAVIVLTILLIALAACQKEKSQPNKSAANTAETAKTTQTPVWAMALTTQPNPPISGKDTLFEVNLSDQSGKPVVGAEVKAELKMQTMDMGKNEVTLAEKGAGSYQGTGQFTMAGPWNVVVTAAKGGDTGHQAFQVVARK